MKKIIVIGCPGSGKSTFSIELSKLIKIPLYHLDLLYWNSDKTTVDREVFIKRLSGILDKEKWIIDGNYGSTLEIRLKECDTVFFLDYPTDICAQGITERLGKKRQDIPWIESELDKEFMEYIYDFNNSSRPQILDLLEKYSDKTTYIFRNREESKLLLSQVQNNV